MLLLARTVQLLTQHLINFTGYFRSPLGALSHANVLSCMYLRYVPQHRTLSLWCLLPQSFMSILLLVPESNFWQLDLIQETSLTRWLKAQTWITPIMTLPSIQVRWVTHLFVPQYSINISSIYCVILFVREKQIFRKILHHNTYSNMLSSLPWSLEW